MSLITATLNLKQFNEETQVKKPLHLFLQLKLPFNQKKSKHSSTFDFVIRVPKSKFFGIVSKSIVTPFFRKKRKIFIHSFKQTQLNLGISSKCSDKITLQLEFNFPQNISIYLFSIQHSPYKYTPIIMSKKEESTHIGNIIGT